MVRVVIADASAAARRLLADILAADPGFAVVGEAADGPAALSVTRRLRPDVLLMDAEIAGDGGFGTTKQIMCEAPTPIVITAAAPSSRQVEASMLALRAGALTILNKPTGPAAAINPEERRRFASTVRTMSQVKVVRQWASPMGHAPRQSEIRAGIPRKIVAIAASTGGPTAILNVLAQLPAGFAAPILVVQHMAQGFMEGFASWLDSGCNLRVKVAQQGEPLADCTVFIAPDGRHLGVSPNQSIDLSNQAPIDGFRPSATYLFRSVAQAAGASTVAVMLTGMGRDGVDGLREVRNRGGLVLVQNEESSVVFGMPGAAIAAGCADRVLGLSDIAARVQEFAQGSMAWRAS